MYPWNKQDPSADAIIRLIEERERNEAKYSHYVDESKNWNIVSLKDASNGNNFSSRPVEDDSSTSHRRRADATMPVALWGKAFTESADKKLRAEIETVEWKVRRRSDSSDEKDLMRSRRDNPKIKRDRNDRGRSGSGERRRKRRQSRSRSGSRSKKRVRSRSRDGKRYRSVSRDRKLDRSDSRDRKHKESDSRDRKRDRSVSVDRKYNKSDRRRSRSNDSDKRRDPSPLKHPKTIELVTGNPASESTTDILSKFVSIISNVQEKSVPNVTQKVPNYNVLPEFDPSNKGHAIVTWLIRVDDVAKLFGWNEKEILQFALPKLVGDANTWYQTLTTVPYSWNDWKKTLLEQYPCPNFGDLLIEMSNRKALPTETFEQYFYAKIVLLNRCGFKGRQAVDCLVQGIETDAIRLCAYAAQFTEPEELLVYLKCSESLRQIPKNEKESTPTIEKKIATPIVKSAKQTNAVCFFCGKRGHKESSCFKKPNQQHFNINQTQKPFPQNQYQRPVEFRPERVYDAPGFKTKALKLPKKCYNCGQSGHMALRCRQPKGIRYLPNTTTMQGEGNAVAAAAPQDTGGVDEPAPPGLEGDF